MVFYFTGTGNSLYIAKKIAKQWEESPVSIPQAIHQKPMEFTADQIGIVAPVYGHELPPMVKDFLQKARFCTDYFFFVLTYGNRHGGAAELVKTQCEQWGITAAYINVVLMVDNWLPSFDMDEQKMLDKQVESQISVILADLKAKKQMISPVSETDRIAHRKFLDRMNQLPGDAWQHLVRIGDGCTGCGICQRVCPSASIRLVEGRAVHLPGNCQTCLACVHACPQKAIGLSVPEKNPQARYRNEHISLQEIIQSNEQTKLNKE